jgi:hypothetical protein
MKKNLNTTFVEFINENKNISNIRSNYNKIIKLLNNNLYKNKLKINIIHFYKIYKILLNKDDITTYQLMLLICLSFSKLFKDNISNIKILDEEIKKNNIYEYENISYNILFNIYKLIIILNKEINKNDINIMFNNNDILLILFQYLNNKKINYYEFNFMFKNELNKKIINYISKY